MGNYCRNQKRKFKTNLEYLVWYQKVRDNHDLFITKSLNLGMFVPCDENGNVLEDNKDMAKSIIDGDNSKEWALNKIKYEKAEVKVLFKGFELENKSKFTTWVEKKGIDIVFTNRGKVNLNDNDVVIIEDLVKYNLELTDNAIKQINL